MIAKALNCNLISIHAPHTRCDSARPHVYCPCFYFNPRTSHEVRRLLFRLRTCIFLNFNPRTSHEVRPKDVDNLTVSPDISIHAPHTRCDNQNIYAFVAQISFQSTHLTRGATLRYKVSGATVNISIHAPHTRCDPKSKSLTITSIFISIHAPHTRCDFRLHRLMPTIQNFNPRTSHEVRPSFAST